MMATLDQDSLNEAVRAIQSAYNTGEKRHVLRAVQSLERCVDEADVVTVVLPEEVFEDTTPYLSSGQPWLDAFFLDGLRREELVLVGGESSMGKTHMLVWIAAQYLLEGRKVLHFNGEDVLYDVKTLYAKAVSGFGKKNPLAELRFIDAVSQTFTSKNIRKGITKVKEMGFEPDLIVVDHLDLLYMGSTDWKAVGNATRELKFCAKENNAILLTASQYHLDSEGKPGKSRLFGGAVSKFQHLDLFLSLDYRDTIGTHISLEKAKGRRVAGKNLRWVVECDLDLMEFNGEEE